MVCVYCGGETQVTNSRSQKRSNQVWRRRQCKRCQAIFTSHEALELSSALFVQSGGSTKPFLPDKLYTEVLLALQDRPGCYSEARELTDTITQKLLKSAEKPYLQPFQISKTAAEVLKRFNKRAWLRYAAEHPSLQGNNKRVRGLEG